MPTVSRTASLAVSYRLNGGAGRPVLFVHATGFCGSVWSPITRRLDERAECWTMDCRGHGESPVDDDTSLDWTSSADDVLAVADAIAAHPHGDDRPLLGVGHSMGGALLLLAEAAKPGTFGALWVFEPIVFPPEALSETTGENPLAAGARRRRAHFAGRTEAHDNYASKPPMQTFDPESLRAYIAGGFRDSPSGDGIDLACRPEVEATNYREGSRHGGFEALASVSCPVVVECGSDAVPGPASVAPRVADALPHGALVRNPSWGHFAPMEHPRQIAAHITESLDLEH